MPVLASFAGIASRGYGFASGTSSAPIQLLLIAGGGSGGKYVGNNSIPGGGGAGGFFEDTSKTLWPSRLNSTAMLEAMRVQPDP